MNLHTRHDRRQFIKRTLAATGTLRNPLDESVHEKPKPAPVVAKAPAPPKKQPPSVTVIRGTDVVNQKAST